MPVELDTKREALEQIRYADRLIGSAIGSLQRLTRQQRFDVFGVDTDGNFAEHDRFVAVFEVIRQSDPALADIEPLADWKLTFKEVVVGALGYHSPYAIAAVVAAGLGYALLAIYY